MKTGIVIDDFKLGMFKEELDAGGFEYEVEKLTEHTTAIKVEVTQGQVQPVYDICTKVQTHFDTLRRSGKN